jgi:precorrin-3B synthase
VRVRPHRGTLSVTALQALAGAAARFGNGQIDLTRRANLQIRGVSPATLAPLWELMTAHDLLDESAERESIRNIVINPLAGLDPSEIADMRPVAAALESRLATDVALCGLPAKFGFALDGGGRLPLAGLAADIHLMASHAAPQPRIAIGLAMPEDVAWLGTTDAGHAAAVATQLAHAVLRHSRTGRALAVPSNALAAIRADLALEAVGPVSIGAAGRSQKRRGAIALTDQMSAVGFGAPFGRLDNETLARLAALFAASGISDIRLSPWRTLYAAAERAVIGELIADAAPLGLIVDDADPLVRIDACSGVGCCPSTGLSTRQHARALAGVMVRGGFSGTLHVSGCAKGCARSAPADLVLVGEDGHYRIVHQGTAKSDSFGTLDPASLDTRGSELFEPNGKTDV